MHQPRPGANGAGERRRTDEYDAAAMQWVSGFVALAGTWIALSPILYAASPAALWNNFVVGGAIAAISVASVGITWRRPGTSTAAVSLVAVLGLWTASAPLVIPFGDPGLAWSNVGAGALIALVAGYHAYAIYQAFSPELPLES